MKDWDVIIIGAGASGLMCAAQAGQRGRSVLVLDAGKRPGRKILIAGGGACNFTNLRIDSSNYISHNPHFCKSSLSRYTQFDFIDLVERYGIPYHERQEGQLFCDHSSRDILDMLLQEARAGGAVTRMNQTVRTVSSQESRYRVETSSETFSADSVVVATGGISLPTAGVSPLGFRIAEHFGLPLVPPAPALVPLTWQTKEKSLFLPLSGISILVTAHCGDVSFTGDLLFTHRGVSGPVALQLSTYWEQGREVILDFLPRKNMGHLLETAQRKNPGKTALNTLALHLPRRLAETLLERSGLASVPVKDVSPKQAKQLTEEIQSFRFTPQGTEGYRTAEATRGGVSTEALSSKTMEAAGRQGLYFIGEVVDVTGQLGGYNLQWAWSSGWAAGQCC
ncbi:hypothetical protein SAMN05920897_109107 [Alkalispirochaeta americana]|uniref:Flavoprotein, HI0933 family n=1 Tax=Alkalispirochaeta americana TaxID=159291 RepID=A0A1N6T466_9SPIO|nr:NAD(P)/FAD-dependent oxidoreductase [Alkalispirochaeta americana]SIQ48064.1 hypothetical protein SAMN05920897_109107 [Alkalispirochaeta americana]